ncbi:ACP S-malonyltransferase [Sanguibacter sp. A247]|uniref:ACP S-malonyltransferase n=1 Tax=unclassified Sanguibacter TaxID=2645534 RepID=UPI003FD7260A
MIAVLCPGQGSQTPGMFNPWLELDGVQARLDEFGAAANLDLVAHGTTSDADTIRDTGVAQPLIVAASLVALREVLGDRPAAGTIDVTAGHSVGELAAAAVAGVLTDVGAVGLVAKRAAAMAAAAAAEPTGMTAILGGDPDDVLAAIAAAGLVPANINGGGQTVAAGSLEALAQLAAAPPARARLVPLTVAGAFHSPFMESARAQFAPLAAAWDASDPTLPLVSNLDGAAYVGGAHGYGTAATVLEHLGHQVVAPVRWDLCQATFAALGVTAILELAPGGVLTGLAKRTLKGVELVAVKTPADLEAARDLVARHSGTTASSEEITA